MKFKCSAMSATSPSIQECIFDQQGSLFIHLFMYSNRPQVGLLISFSNLSVQEIYPLGKYSQFQAPW